jgi:competence protein ComEC
MIVLAAAPEALMHPNFQMSFAATLGPVVLDRSAAPIATPDSSMATKIALWGGRELVMLLLASLVAGFATTPYAAFHFHRIALYGVLANLAAMPVVSALLMPMGCSGLRRCLLSIAASAPEGRTVRCRNPAPRKSKS